jgi:hypothetical protein
LQISDVNKRLICILDNSARFCQTCAAVCETQPDCCWVWERARCTLRTQQNSRQTLLFSPHSRPICTRSGCTGSAFIMNSRAALFSAQPSVLNAAADAHALCVPIVCKSAYTPHLLCKLCLQPVQCVSPYICTRAFKTHFEQSGCS